MSLIPFSDVSDSCLDSGSNDFSLVQTVTLLNIAGVNGSPCWLVCCPRGAQVQQSLSTDRTAGSVFVLAQADEYD